MPSPTITDTGTTRLTATGRMDGVRITVTASIYADDES